MKIRNIRRSLKLNRKGSIGALFLVFVLMLAVIAAGIVVFFIVQAGPYSIIGEINEGYQSTANLNVTLNVYNEVGSVNIFYNDSLYFIDFKYG